MTELNICKHVKIFKDGFSQIPLVKISLVMFVAAYNDQNSNDCNITDSNVDDGDDDMMMKTKKDAGSYSTMMITTSVIMTTGWCTLHKHINV